MQFNYLDAQSWKLRARNNRQAFTVPSIYSLVDRKVIPSRRAVMGREFLDKALDGVDTGSPRCYRANVRSAVNDCVDKAVKDKSMHFTRGELTTLFNIFFTLTGHEIRPMTQAELSQFLYLTLGITNTTTLNGLYRAGIKLMYGNDVKSVGKMNANAFVNLLSILLRGTIEQRASLAFHVCDVDDDLYIKPRVEFEAHLRHSFDPNIAASAPEIDPFEPYRDTLRYLMNKLKSAKDGKITELDFVQECKAFPWLIEGLIPTIPMETANLAMQDLFSPKLKLPSIDTRPPPSKLSQRFKSKKRS